MRSGTFLFGVEVALALSAPVHAQSYGGYGSGSGTAESGDDEAEDQGQRASERRTEIRPYIEASQGFIWEISPGDDVVTYTQLAAGVDAAITGRNVGGTVSLRYERNFSWSDEMADNDTLSGIIRGYAAVIPNVLTIEAGALASTSRIDQSGASTMNPLVGDDLTSTTYAVYAGPTLQTQVGDVGVSANYRIGYTRVDGPDSLATNGTLVDVFDESVAHSANIRLGTSPGEPLPVGIGVGAGFYQEDIDNLDQRVRDAYVRGDVTVPVTPTLAIVGGIGLEDVEVSSRDALRDADGVPVIGADGRYVTDTSGPRRIAYDADGLIWDVGVVWRPSRRTQLQATFGHRYDSETFYGSFNWQPDRRSNLGINVYDGINGFGGRMTNSLANLPAEFEVIRDPVSGDITGCVNSTNGQGCLDALLGSARSAVFRGRGISANYSRQIGQMTAGIGAGYERRKFIGAEGTVLAAANGIVDESYYISAGVSGPVGRQGNFSVNTYANWFDSGTATVGDVLALGSSVAYGHNLTRKLSARAALALTYLDSDASLDDLIALNALVGLRYDF